MAKKHCPGAGIIFRSTSGRCPSGCVKVIYEYWWAFESAAERNDPDEICTERWYKIYRRGHGPQPPAHYGCNCRRWFAFYMCLGPGDRPPVFNRRWDPEKKDFRDDE